MTFHKSGYKLKIQASLAAFALLAFSLVTTNAVAALPGRNVPSGVAIAKDQGRVDPGKELNLTLMLKMHNRAEFDKAVEDLYDPASSHYRQWFTDEDFARYAPTTQEFETVRNELLKQGFSVLSSDPRRFSIRVHGTAANVEKAFQTELHTFSYNGTVFQAHTRDAQLTGAAGALVDSVSGIEQHQTHPKLSYIKNPKTGKPLIQKPLATKQDASGFLGSLTDTPLTAPAPEAFANSDGTVVSYFYGWQYTANGQTAAFTPAQLEDHYGLTSVIKDGYNGAGQTIALVEGYGYPTAEADANEAANLFGLPPLTSSNFSVIYPEGPPVNPEGGILTGWDVEIALDIQSAHAIAPGAKILVVASSGQDNEDQIASLNYIIARTGSTTPLAYTVSNSWENDAEIVSGVLEEEAFNTVLETGVAAGISFQFSSGDGGDQGLATPVGAVSIPSNSPYATAVGGTSVLNNPYGNGQIVTGWGNNIVFLNDFGALDPLEGYFFGGAGGGQSQYFAKPSWQKELPGTWRLVPDVSALADPFTGFPLVLTESGEQFGLVVGGTSLASPIFTATWAIADQYNGKPLGFAAPIVSRLTSNQIHDVLVPLTPIRKYNVWGLIKDSSGLTSYDPAQIFTSAINEFPPPNYLSLYSQTDFFSANWPGAFGEPQVDVAVSFGTDSSLTTDNGWDNVTGWGEPNGLPFIQGVTGKTTGAKVEK
jgi:subtilase family serine protease